MWNIGYNSVLGAVVPNGIYIVCYADDTLIITGGKDWTQKLRQIEAVVSAVIIEVNSLGLKIAVQKTECSTIPTPTANMSMRQE